MDLGTVPIFFQLDKVSFFGVALYDHYPVRPLSTAVTDVKSMGIHCIIVGHGADTWTTSAQCYHRGDLVQNKAFGQNGVRGIIAYTA